MGFMHPALKAQPFRLCYGKHEEPWLPSGGGRERRRERANAQLKCHVFWINKNWFKNKHQLNLLRLGQITLLLKRTEKMTPTLFWFHVTQKGSEGGGGDATALTATKCKCSVIISPPFSKSITCQKISNCLLNYLWINSLNTSPLINFNESDECLKLSPITSALIRKVLRHISWGCHQLSKYLSSYFQK